MIKKQLSIFLVVGSLTVLVDYMFYSMLLFAELSHDPAKTLGFIAGTIFAYFANKKFTFSTHGNTKRFFYFVILYMTTLALNVGANHILLGLLGTKPIFVNIAFVAATGLSATTNFLGMKFMVFRDN